MLEVTYQAISTATEKTYPVHPLAIVVRDSTVYLVGRIRDYDDIRILAMRDDDDKPVLRDMAGRFQPGSKPLSLGRKPIDAEVRSIFEAAAPAAAQKPVQLAFEAKDPKVGLAACEMILNRLFGRPAMQINARVEGTSIQEAHLKALMDIQEARQRRLLELAPQKVEN